MKIVCLLSSLSQPRCIKRVNSFVEAGFEVEVYGYSRGFYDVNSLPAKVKITNWGMVKSGRGYWERLWQNFKRIKWLLSHNKHTNVLYYAFGFDFSLILSIVRPKSFIYESSDLIYTYSRNILWVGMFRMIDKMIIRRSYQTVFTSEGFQDYLFGKCPPNNVIIQPNKVSSYFQNFNRKNRSFYGKSELIFAYVGALRYPNTVFRFARIIGEKYPQYSFYFYGDSQYTYLAKELSQKYENVKYFGKFKNPEDLENIYASIDIVVACYETSTLNEKIAEPNKLYEAICFCKPIIVSIGTFLEKRVRDLKIGYAIDASDDKSIEEFLGNLDFGELNKMSLHEKKLGKDVYIDSAKNIINVIKEYNR